MHELGFSNTQSLRDLDNYVTINTGNIQWFKGHNFDQADSSYTDQGTYDYGSIMHYGPTAFSSPAGAITIQAKPSPTPAPLGAPANMGQRTALSANDIAIVNAAYP